MTNFGASVRVVRFEPLELGESPPLGDQSAADPAAALAERDPAPLGSEVDA